MAQQKINITTTQREIDQKKLAKESMVWLKKTNSQLLFKLGTLNLYQKSKLMSSLRRRKPKDILTKNLGYKLNKVRGEVSRLSFSFVRHGIFLERGVGKNRPVNSSAAKSSAKPWLEPVLKPAIEDLADSLAEFYSDEIADEIRFLVPGIIDERVKL